MAKLVFRFVKYFQEKTEQKYFRPECPFTITSQTPSQVLHKQINIHTKKVGNLSTTVEEVNIKFNKVVENRNITSSADFLKKSSKIESITFIRTFDHINKLNVKVD